MSQSTPILEPELNDQSHIGRWMVVIFNNETNSYDEVIEILMRSTKCDLEEAMIETWEAHHYGKAPVHFASQSECDRIAAMIASIGVGTEVCREWED
ncbi:MAG: ATP-dependent Clp protease adaptor ClpS [Fimbriimonas sp.]